MADDIVLSNQFDLGIEGSAVYGNLKEAEAFLSENTVVKANPDEIIKNVKQEVKPEEKKPEEKPTINPIDLLVDEEEEPKEEPIKETNEPEESQFEMISKELLALEVFTEDEDTVLPKTAEEFAERFKEEKRKGATAWLENYLERFGEDRRKLFDDIFVNGVDPKEYLATFNGIENLSNVDLNDEGNQEKVIRAFYEKNGWSQDKIDNKISKLKTSFDLEDEAKTVHPILLEKEKEKLDEQVANNQKKQEASLRLDEDYKNNISKVFQEKLKDKNIDGLPLTDKEARSTFDYLYSKKWKAANGELLTDFDKFILESKRPENITNRIKIALLAQSNFDFSKIEKKAIGKEGNSLFQGLALQKKKGKTETTKTSNASWSEL